MSASPSRRHAARAAHRRWEDVSEWPFQFIILPVLVAFAFLLVLFLGSKHGTRLAAFRTWLPANTPCKSEHCIQAITVDSEGGVVARLAEVGPGGGTTGGALSSLAGFLRLDSGAKTGEASAAAADITGVIPLTAEDLLKYNFDYWLAEGERLAGQQSKDCDAGYGPDYISKWRKARVAWCSSPLGGPVTESGGGSGSSAAASSSTSSRSATNRHLQQISSASISGKTTVEANESGSSSSGSNAFEMHLAAAARGDASDPNAAAAGASALSSIALYPFYDKDASLMFAVANNAVLDSRSFGGSSAHQTPETNLRGSLAAACQLADNKSGPSVPGEDFMRLEAVRMWTQDALRADEYGRVSQACATRASNGPVSSPSDVIDHPVLLLSRFDPSSAFRTMEEIAYTFTVLAALKDPRISKEGMQVVIADGKPDGIYLDLWAALSRPYPLRLLAQKPWPKPTCLSHAVLNMYGGSSILTSMGVARRTTCRSSVVIAASLWLRHMLGAAIQPPLRSAFGSQRQNKGMVRKSVVWISRRNYEGLAHANMTPWQHQRRFENEGEVVLELQREVWRWNDESCIRSGLTKSFGARLRRQSQRHQRHLLTPYLRFDSASSAVDDRMDHHQHLRGVTADETAHRVRADGEDALDGGQSSGSSQTAAVGMWRRLQGVTKCRSSSVFYDLRVVEFNDIPFYPDHVQVLGHATVLAGAHGTGLANMMWMPPGNGGVLELHHNSAGNDHYLNQAQLLGHKYVNVDSDGDRVNLTAAAAGLRKLLDMLE